MRATVSWCLAVFGLACPFLVVFVLGRHSLALYWPTAVSLAFLFSFGRTLFSPPSMVERFARLQKSALSDAEMDYCRKVTLVWCLFFLINALAALYLALAHSLKAWALYTGVLSYGLIGILYGAEYFYRHWRFRPAGAWLTRWMERRPSETTPT